MKKAVIFCIGCARHRFSFSLPQKERAGCLKRYFKEMTDLAQRTDK